MTTWVVVYIEICNYFMKTSINVYVSCVIHAFTFWIRNVATPPPTPIINSFSERWYSVNSADYCAEFFLGMRVGYTEESYIFTCCYIDTVFMCDLFLFLSFFMCLNDELRPPIVINLPDSRYCFHCTT